MNRKIRCIYAQWNKWNGYTHTHNGLLAIKILTLAICNNLDGPRGY